MLQTKRSISAQSRAAFQFKPLRPLLAAVVLFSSAATALATLGGQSPGQTIVFPTAIQWQKQTGVTRFRLQIGGDEAFRDIFWDRRVVGSRYTVSDLPPGYYYWRVAPADGSLGAFSRPVRFFVSGGVVMPTPVRSIRFRSVLAIKTLSAGCIPNFDAKAKDGGRI